MFIWIKVKLRELEELDNQLGEEYAKINSKIILFFIVFFFLCREQLIC